MQYKNRFTLAATMVLAGLITLATGASTGQASSHTVRTDGQAGIAVKAAYVTAASLRTNPNGPLSGKVDLQQNIVFAITLDTHSGDLSQYDFLKNAALRSNRGVQVAPSRWVATADGSHHRAGGLVFPKADQTGRAVEAQARVLELVIRDLGVVERVLRWSLPLE
ncbi:MAG: hypothetical protein QME77_06065 [bacterium]|nr:hypothetical protein [bacterium]